MTEITKSHTEWAVVDRLRALLTEKPHADYSVTQSYGLCVAILAWVMQRIRMPEKQANSPEDQAAIAVCRSLDQQKVEASPWSLKTHGAQDTISEHGDFKDFTAFNFLKWLRDAICHGDARQISPVNTGNSLTGFTVCATAKGDRERSLVLTERDLRRIGEGLASMYCDALQSAASSSLGHFAEDARSIREKGREA